MENRGFVQFIVVIIVIIVILAYFNVDLRGTWDYWTSVPWVMHTWQVVAAYWSRYLAPAFSWASAFIPENPAGSGTTTLQ